MPAAYKVVNDNQKESMLLHLARETVFAIYEQLSHSDIEDKGFAGTVTALTHYPQSI